MRGVMHVPDPCATFRFSTAGLPEPARAQAVRYLHLRERTMSVGPGSSRSSRSCRCLIAHLHVDVIKRTLARTRRRVWNAVRRVPRTTTQRGRRARRGTICLLAVNVWGCSLARQRDTRADRCETATLFFGREILPGSASCGSHPPRFLGCRVARAEVAALLGRLDDTPMCFVPRDTEALQLLVTYARGIAESVPLATPELQRLAVSHMHDLMAAIVAATRGGQAIAEGRGIAAARLQSDHDRHQSPSRRWAICRSPRSRSATA